MLISAKNALLLVLLDGVVDLLRGHLEFGTRPLGDFAHHVIGHGGRTVRDVVPWGDGLRAVGESNAVC